MSSGSGSIITLKSRKIWQRYSEFISRKFRQINLEDVAILRKKKKKYSLTSNKYWNYIVLTILLLLLLIDEVEAMKSFGIK